MTPTLKEILTPREFSFLELLTQGYTHEEISTLKQTGVRNVEAAMQWVYKKLHISRNEGIPNPTLVAVAVFRKAYPQTPIRPVELDKPERTKRVRRYQPLRFT